MIAKRRIFLVFSVILILTVFFSIRSVYFKREGEGFGYLTDDGITVRYVYINHITNISIFPKTVTFEAFSYIDAENSFIKEPELEVVLIGMYNRDIPNEVEYIKGITFTLEPFTSYMIQIQCEGNYGGNGKGVRHPPDTIKIKY